MWPTRPVSNIYNPLNQTEEELLNSFVVREKEFNIIFDDIKSSDMSHPETHYIIQGQRGQGKTTLLLKLYYEINRDKNLGRFLIPIIFNEEQYSINTLFGLWAYTADRLEDENPDYTGIYDAIENTYGNEYAEMDAFKLLEETLKKRKKKLVLLIDNIGQMLDKLTEIEQHRLREVLITSPEIRIIGASSVVLEHTYDYTKPFYELFRVINLEGLTEKETQKLLLKLGEYYKQENIEEIVKKETGRVETLRRLTEGVPRTIVLLFEIFLDHENGNAFHDLELILDRVTPLYKHRMDELSASQQKIVDTVALNWDAIAVKDISEKTHIESKAISSQLKLLEKNRIIHKIKTTTKNHLYQVTERFFNIWYLMRSGRRRGKSRVKWLAHFLESWCSEDDLSQRAQRHIFALQKGELTPKYAFYMTEALASTRISWDLQHDLIAETQKYLGRENKRLSGELSEPDHELYEKGKGYLENHEYKKALRCFESIRNKNPDVLVYLGIIHQNSVKNIEKAEMYYLKALEDGHSGAIFSIALLYDEVFKDNENAEKYYLMAVDKGIPEAMVNLAFLYEREYKDYKNAEKYYLMAVDKGILKAMVNLAFLYAGKHEDYKKAEKYYLMAAERGDIMAMNNLGFLYRHKFKDPEKAEYYLNMAVKRGDHTAMQNLARLNFELKKNKSQSLELLLDAGKKKDDIRYSHNLSVVLLWNNEFEESLKVQKELLKKEEYVDKSVSGITEYILLLLAKKQYYAALRIFEESPFDLKERVKPIYYALMYFLQDDFPNEYRKMGSELRQTVEEVIAKVHQWEKDYA